ncbi:mechanosensitive ion channel protein MscS [Longibacter salinarum]|uniref:Mechanosensitive ion channel protein MscS n=1 Tax=Longibacter salinarum TaxID=1850348 RepID=A0A2A8CTV2_9BACT|nr:mechanosensitive ion channel family protein [Longibacter salinarum]PEN11322.1 mechanosensitive ion channel protein MscS [Longibacter salinarum]
MEWQSFLESAYRWLITTGAEILVILLVTVIALRLLRALIDRFNRSLENGKRDGEAIKRADTLSSVIRYAAQIIIWVIAAMMVLGALGIDIGPILAAAGVLGLAVGFGAQSLVQDVISGFFILLEDQIRVGDVVDIAGKGGVVERLNLRMVVLRDLSGNVHYVRNNQIDVVTNMTKEFSYYVFDIGIAYRENVDEAIEIIQRVGADLRDDPDYQDDILDDLEVLGVDQLGDSAVVIKARFKTKPIKQWRVGREYNRRIKSAFDAENIEIPFPHMTVYMGEDKDGAAPPMHVQLNNDGESQPSGSTTAQG